MPRRICAPPGTATMPDPIIEHRPQASQAECFNIANRGRKVGHAGAASPTIIRAPPSVAQLQPLRIGRPAVTGQPRRSDGCREEACGAVAGVVRKEASAEVVAAIAYASSHHAAWLWDGVGAEGRR